jgi:hypothetical protein
MRELRSLLARDNYYDVDIVNCDPTILAQYCAKHHATLSIPRLNNYVSNRDSLLSELMNKNNITKSQSKDVILQISKGGTNAYSNLKDRPQWLVDLKKEFKEIGSVISESVELEPNKGAKCKWGSILSQVVQEIENNIIQCLDEFLTSKDYNVDTLIFDGVLVRNNKKLTQDMLNLASDYICDETGYRVKLLVKPFDETLKVPDTLMSEDEEYAELKKEFEKNVCKIMNPLSYLVMTKDNQFIYKTRVDLINTYENHSDWKGTTIVGGKLRKSFIENWVKDPRNLSYDKIDFLPPPLQCPSSTYNTFKGFDVNKIENPQYEEEYVKTIREHTKFLVGDNDVNNAYLEAFLANIIQEPANLSKVAIILKSREGCGKNLFLEIIEAILGKEYYITNTSPKQKLFGQFNAHKMNKLLINLDETNPKDSKDYYETIKAEITNSTTEIERKGQDSFVVRNFARYLFTTNNELPIKISKSDRRFALFECKGKRKDKKYYDALVKIKDNDNALYSYYTYLNSIEIADYDFINNRPETDFYKRSMKQCEENIYEYLQSLVMNEIEVDDENVKLKDNTYSYRASVMFQDYTQFCINHKYVDRLTSGSFGSTILMIASKSRDKKGHVYKFEKSSIENYLRENDYWEEPEKCLLE